MGRFSPSVLPGPSWTQSMAQGASTIAQALEQKRRDRDADNQVDLQNAERGIFRGSAPASSTLSVDTPDYQINDPVGGSGPTVSQTQGAGYSYSDRAQAPGGMAVTGGQLNAARPRVNFQGPTGSGLVNTDRYTQVPTKSGDSFYVDQEQTPYAQRLRQAEVTGEGALNRALLAGTLRNQGIQYRTDANIEASGPQGARTLGKEAVERAGAAAKHSEDTFLYGDPTDPSAPKGAKTVSAEDINYHRPHYQSARGGTGPGSASDPTVRASSTVARQITQTNTSINQAQREASSAAGVMEQMNAKAHPDQPHPLMDAVRTLQARRDSLTSVQDSLSSEIQRHSSTAPHAPVTGAQADAPAPAPGSQTPTVQHPGPNGRVDAHQDTAPKQPMPASPLAGAAAQRSAIGQSYAAALGKLHKRSDLSQQEVAEKEQQLANMYHQKVSSLQP